MAKELAALMNAREHMVINPNTSGTSEHVASYMKDSAWTGELVVQLKDDDASLWTLAKDNETAIEFVSKTVIEKLTDVQISAITPTEANVKEEYALVNSDGDIMGDTVKIYKDSALVEVYLGHVDDELISDDSPAHTTGTGDTALCFIYYLSSGKYSLTAINIEDFLQENEFADGLQVNNHVVSVKIDPTSEPVITEYSGTSALTEEQVISVGPDGIKIANIQDAIDAAIGTVNGFTAVTDGVNTIEADEPGAELTVLGSDTVDVEIDESGKTITFSSPEVTVSTDTYMSAAVDNHAIELETNVVDSVEEFSGSTELGGKLVDADVIKTIIVDNEEVVAAAINDLNDRLEEVIEIIEISAATKDIATSTQLGQGHADAYDVKTFALNDVDTTDSATTSNVRVVSVDGLRKLDFSRMVIDCGSF